MAALPLVLALAAGVLAGSGAAHAAGGPVREVSAGGSHFAFGEAVGAATKAEISGYLNASSTVNDVLLPFYANNRTAYDAFVASNSAAYPAYWQELEGMSAGSGVPLHLFALVAFREEIELLTRATARPDREACTDVYAGGVLLAHNEDGSPLIRGRGFLLRAAIDGVPPFVSYNYPAALAGTSFGFNGNGVCLTYNAVFPRGVRVGGLARAFLNRDVFAAADVADAVRRATAPGAASGFSLNLARAGAAPNGTNQVNVEVSPDGFALRRVAPRANWTHVNEYRVLDAPQFPDVSSAHRLARVDAMPAVVDRRTALAVLGDTADPLYPIYRDGAPPDRDVTLATALFNLTAAAPSMDLWVAANPNENAPDATLPVPAATRP